MDTGRREKCVFQPWPPEPNFKLGFKEIIFSAPEAGRKPGWRPGSLLCRLQTPEPGLALLTAPAGVGGPRTRLGHAVSRGHTPRPDHWVFELFGPPDV